MDFSSDQLRILLESLEYSLQRVRDAKDTPHSVRQEKLNELSEVKARVRQLLQKVN